MSDPSLKAAAAAVLGVETDAPEVVVRAAFLRALRRSQFSPAPVVVEAAAVAGQFPGLVRPTPHLGAKAEADLRDEVEQFAEQYWSIQPAERRARWQDFFAASDSYPRLQARLRLLEDGLDLVPPGADAGPLAAAIVQLYPLKPTARAAARRAALTDKVPPTASERLCRNHPHVARLDHGLLAPLLNTPKPVADLQPYRVPTVAPPPTNTTGGGRTYWILLVVVFVIMGGMQAAFRAKDDRQRTGGDTFKLNPLPKFKLSPEDQKQMAELFGPRRPLPMFHPHQWRVLGELLAARELPPDKLTEVAQRFRTLPPLNQDQTRVPADRPYPPRQRTLLTLLDRPADKTEAEVADLLRQLHRSNWSDPANGLGRPALRKQHQVVLHMLAKRDDVPKRELDGYAFEFLSQDPVHVDGLPAADDFTPRQRLVADRLATWTPDTVAVASAFLADFVAAGKADREGAEPPKRP